MKKSSDYDHKQVIVMRKDLNMRKGKLIAQGCHASMGALLSLQVPSNDRQTMTLKLDSRIVPWLEGKFKKIVVYVNSEQELIDLEKRAKHACLITCLITDSGLTEFNGVPTITCLAIGPDIDFVVDKFTGNLPLM